MTRLIIALLFLFSLSLSAQVYSGVELYERDSESWSHDGTRNTSGGMIFNGSHIVESNDAIQRFNPTVYSRHLSLNDVQLKVTLPNRITVIQSKNWSVQKNADTTSYSIKLKSINPGERQGVSDVLTWRGDKKYYVIKYEIRASELKIPVVGSVPVNR